MIEACLRHAIPDEVEAVYRRADFHLKRTKLMQAGVRDRCKVVLFRRRQNQLPRHDDLSVSLEMANARIGHPLTPGSVAGVNRRVNRRTTRRAYYGATVGAGIGAAAVGTAAAGAYYGYGYPSSGCYGEPLYNAAAAPEPVAAAPAAVAAAEAPGPTGPDFASPSAGAIDQVKREAAALSAEWGPKLSVFWADRYFSVGRFPPLDRLDYIEFSVVLMERERVRPTRPALDDIRLYLSGAPFANWAERARQFAAATALEPKDRKPYLRALLYPARFCYGYIAGRIWSSDDAVAFLHECPPSGLDLISIDRALQCRRSADDPDWLFVLRSTLPAQVEACVR